MYKFVCLEIIFIRKHNYFASAILLMFFTIKIVESR